MAGKVATKWVLETPTEPLAEAVRFARLNANAIALLPGTEDDGALTYPSYFCPDPKAWMQALAYLTRHHVQFRLFICEFEGEREIARTRIFPELDAEMRELLGRINRDAADQISEYGALVAHILERMRTERNSYDE